MNFLIGRYGYNGSDGLKGGGINSDRVEGNNVPKINMKKLRMYAIELLDSGQDDECNTFLCQLVKMSIVTQDQVDVFLNKYFTGRYSTV